MSVRHIRVCDICGIEARGEPWSDAPAGWVRLEVRTADHVELEGEVCATCKDKLRVACDSVGLPWKYQPTPR